MHILVLYMYYLRPGDPGIRRFNEFCRLWADEPGVRVTVVTGQIQNVSKSEYPDLVGKPVAREMDGKVEVIRIAGPRTYHAGFKGRALSQIGWAHRVRSYLGQLERPDVIIASSPPLFVASPAIAAKRRFRAPCIVEVRDLWPDAIVQFGVASPRHPAISYLARLERWAYRHADHVVGIVETMKTSIVQRGLKRAEDVSVITNGVLLEDFDSVPEESRWRIRAALDVGDNDTLVIYTGTHGPLHDVDKFVDLAGALAHRPDIRLVSIGGGPDLPRLEEETQRRGLINLRFLGPLPAADLPGYLRAADIGCPLGNTTAGTGWEDAQRGAFRNTFFDMAGAKLPLVFNLPGYSKEELEDRAGAGFFSDTNAGLADMASKVERLADDPALRRRMGENNYREIAVRYNRRRMAAEYLDLMRRLAG